MPVDRVPGNLSCNCGSEEYKGGSGKTSNVEYLYTLAKVTVDLPLWEPFLHVTR